MFLTDRKIKLEKPATKSKFLNDGGGLQLEIKPHGIKLWRYRCTINGKRTRLSLGEYPAVSLKAAREKRDELKTLIAQGIDPRTAKETPKEESQSFTSVKDMVEQYLNHYRADRNEKYWQGVESLFRRDVLPIIGNLPIEEINSKQIVTIVQAVQSRGAVESAKRLFTQISKVFKFAIAHGECTRNPCGDIERSMVLQKPTGRNYPTITDPKEIGKLMYDIDHYTGWYMVRFGLLFLAYSAIRPGNVRLAEWSEIDWDKKQWIIPGEKMKTGKEHIVPLSRQMLEILKFAKHYATGGKYIFFSNRHKNSPMSDVTFSKALWRMGYGNDTIVPHGFRAMFSTIANEHSEYGFEVIETQLAHRIGSKVAQAYNRAQYLPQRKKMMQWWADWLDERKRKREIELNNLDKGYQI